MPKLVDICQRRQEVTEAVIGLIESGGTDAVTMRAVADRAGISLSSLRMNWPTRELVVDLAVAHLKRGRELGHRSALFSVQERSASSLVRALLPMEDADRTRERAWQLLSVLPGLSERSRRWLASARLERRAMFEVILARVGGVVPGDELERATVTLMALADGLSLALCEREAALDTELASAVVEHVLEHFGGALTGRVLVSDR